MLGNILLQTKKFNTASFFKAAPMLALALVWIVATVFADSSTIDFESYSLGTVNGQDGWSSTGAAGSGCALYDHMIVDSTPFGYSSFGTQSLRISNAVTSGCFGDQTFSKSLIDEAGETTAVNDGLSGGTRQTYFEAQWDFASTVPGSEQSGLSVVASPDRGDGARMSWIQMADTPTGLDVNFYDYQEDAVPATCDDNDFVFANVATGLDRTQAHTIKIKIYFVDGAANDIVQVYVDGTLVHTGTTWEDYFRDCESNPTRPVDSILFRTSGTAAPATAGNGFLIDNLTLASSTPACTSVCYVDEVNGNDVFGGDTIATAKKTIQAGIDAVSPNGQVRVLPGSYSESAVNRYVLGVNGPHQFGLFIPQSKNGISIIGVDGSDTPITDYNSLLASVETNATNNFGYSGIFVEGDDVTIQGLRILPNVPGDNKTIEVIGDNFTLQYSKVDVDGGSVYFNDWQYDDNGTPSDSSDDTSYLQSYHINANWFATSTSLDLTSGAGFSGPVGWRVIENNKFDNAYYWPSISFSGSDTGVPWFQYSVGGAVIQDNTFTNTSNTPDDTSGHIRARGTYDNSQFDWTSYWQDNTFNRAAVTLIGSFPPFDVQTYSYPNSYGTFNNVRRIGVTIQGEVDRAVASDTVLVNQGTYVEQVSVPLTLDLIGEDGATLTFIQAPSTIPVASDPESNIVKVAGTGVNVEMSGFTVAGPGPSGCGSIARGIFVRDDAYGNIHDNRVVDIRDSSFSGCQNGIGIQVGSVSLTTNGSADIENNTIQGYQKGGIVVSNTASSALIANNTIIGAGPTTIIAQNGVQVSGGATADINDNQISGNSYTPFTYVSAGMLIYGSSETNTDGNTLDENQVGIYIIDTPGDHNGNTIGATSSGTGSPGFWGAVVDAPPPTHIPSPFDIPAKQTSANARSSNSIQALTSSDQKVTVTNSVFTSDNSSGGIGLEADSGFGSFDIDLTATNNFFTNWEVGVEIYECPANCTGTTFSNLHVNLNSITGNQTGYDHTSASFSADGIKNWWGSASGPAGVGPGTGDSVSLNIDFDPWLCDGTDTSPSIGFQPNETITCTGTPSPTPTNTATDTPTYTPSPTPTDTATNTPTNTYTPTATPSGQICEGNLLQNWSFELPLVHGQGILYWKEKPYEGSIFQGPGYQADGINGAFIGPKEQLYQNLSAVSGDTYLLTFWAGTHDPRQNEKVSLEFLNSSNQVIGSQTVNIDYDVDYDHTAPRVTQYSIELTAPHGTVTVRVIARNNGWNTFKFDAACLTK